MAALQHKHPAKLLLPNFVVDALPTTCLCAMLFADVYQSTANLINAYHQLRHLQQVRISNATNALSRV